ncbi:MAG: hypothetical protein ACRELB_05550 [Polyangiaceae bacterium]
MQQSGSRCMRCGGSRVTPRTKLDSGYPPYLIYKGPRPGIFDQGLRLPLEGAACLDCGHVEIFLSSEALQKAREQRSLTPW